MPITTQHFNAAASILAVGLGVAAVARTMPSASRPISEPYPGNSASAQSPPEPNYCRQACADLDPRCSAGVDVNCVEALSKLDRAGTVSCADGISADELRAIGWCP